jgi:hypothetical protein
MQIINLDKVWLYDIVYNKSEQIVAINYHQAASRINGYRPYHPDCLMNDQDKLIAEGLHLDVSLTYATLEEAKASVETLRHKFHSSLD